MRPVSGAEIEPQKAATKVAAFFVLVFGAVSAERQSRNLFLFGAGVAIAAGVVAFYHVFPRFCPNCRKEMDKRKFWVLNKQAYICRRCRVYAELRTIPRY
jgi:hypothetical protein